MGGGKLGKGADPTGASRWSGEGHPTGDLIRPARWRFFTSTSRDC